MSTLEKSLYKQVSVKRSNNSDRVTTERSPTYRGFSTVNTELNSHVLHDIALIKQDLINHFHIRQGEKLSDPEFGTIIWDILFEPLTDTVKNAIVENVSRIINYDPRVQVNQITVDSYESGIQIECELAYLPYSIVEKMQLKFDEDSGFLTQ
jgi:phage baseplate assembly protein W